MQSALTWDSLMYSHFHSCSIMPSTLSWLMSAAIAAVSSRSRRVEEEDCLRPIARGARPEQSGRGARGDMLQRNRLRRVGGARDVSRPGQRVGLRLTTSLALSEQVSMTDDRLESQTTAEL